MTTTISNDPVLAPLPFGQTPVAPPRHPHLDLFLISFLILFFELACIRWFGSTVVFLTFFTNIVLLASFLGMSTGLLTATRRRNFIRWALPLTLLTVALALVTYWAYAKYSARVTIDVGDQKSPQLIYFGTEYRPKDPSRFVIPLEAIAGTFFVLIAVMFVGLGQTMGRAFDAIPNRVRAYTTDVLGSLTGIAAFFAMSWFKLSPHVWFVVVMLLLLYFVSARWNAVQVISAMATMFLIAMSAYGVGFSGGVGQVFWSPYYKITYTPQSGDIDTNNISHQEMHNIKEAGPAYALPHLLNRDADGEPFKNVMIIGAGSGNDVSAALAYGAEKIDAVEIDPVIQHIGAGDHPDRPYSDPRVKFQNTDGRRFVRKTDKQYDMITYALVDSLVLHSGYSSLRLESFLFTREAFADIEKKLKPGGVFTMYNYYRQGWVVGRLKTIAQEVFGVEPLVISLGQINPDPAGPHVEHQENISAESNQANYITFLMVGKKDENGKVPALDAIKQRFSDVGPFWLNESPRNNDAVVDQYSVAPADYGGYSANEPFPTERGRWLKIAPTEVNTANIGPLPEDNWPFLYLRSKHIPLAPTGRGVIMVAVLSLAVLLSFSLPIWIGRGGVRALPNGQMFFLGAGFMLLETKGVVHMALLFGSTWVVNSVVFFAILVMILLSNLFVSAFKPQKLWPYYAALVVALLINAFVPLNVFLSLDPTARTITSCAVVFVPIFFAGVIFAASFRDSRDPATDFGSNVAGIILGGLSENLSLMIGFNYLVLVAAGFYVLSMVLRPRLLRANAAPAV